MRLTCPNCAAQYEVDGRVIPETGRDVQCSNCGHAWFQPPEGAAMAEVARPAAEAVAEPAPEPAPEPVPEPAAEPLPEAVAETIAEALAAPDTEAAPAPPADAAAVSEPAPSEAAPPDLDAPQPPQDAPVLPQRPRRWRNPERQVPHLAEEPDAGANPGTGPGPGLGPALAAALAPAGPAAPEEAFSPAALADRRAPDLPSEAAPTADPGPLAGGEPPVAKDLDPDVPADSRPAAETSSLRDLPSLRDLIAEVTAPRPAAGAAVPPMTAAAEQKPAPEAEQDAAPAAAPAIAADRLAEPVAAPTAAPEAAPMVAPLAATSPAADATPAPAPAQSQTDEAEAEASPAFQPPPGLRLRRRPVTPSALEVLRGEAERESARRQGRPLPAAPLETQPELGLPAPDGRRGPIAPAFAAALDDAAAPETPHDRLPAALRGTPAAAAIKALANPQAGPADDITPNAPPRTPRRDLLPDVEEINSTLRATSERGDEPAARDAPETLRRQRGSFRLGFGLALCAALALVALYVGAPRIGQMVPPLAPAMMGYADRVDAARLWLDGLVSGQPAAPAPSSQG